MAKARQTIHRVTVRKTTTTSAKTRSSKSQTRCPTCGKFMKKK